MAEAQCWARQPQHAGGSHPSCIVPHINRPAACIPSSEVALPAKFFTESIASVHRNTKPITDQGDDWLDPICTSKSRPQTVVFVTQVSR